MILRKALEEYYVQLGPCEYSERLQQLQPELKKLTAELDQTSERLRKEFTAKVETAIVATFKKLSSRPQSRR